MTIPLTGTGGLFTRLGKIGGALNNINKFLGTTDISAGGLKAVGPAIDAIFGQFESADQLLVSGLYPARDAYRGVHNSMTAYLQSLAQATVIQMANDDSPLTNPTLANALTLLIQQMTGVDSVPQPTVSASASGASGNIGKGVLAASVLGPKGVQQDYAYAEAITATCTADGQGTGTAGRETFSVTSPAAESNPLAWDWPLGTAINTTLSAVDATVDNSGGNILQNGSFKTWTNPSVGPDNWLILGGPVGTNVTQATGSNVYKGNTGLAFVGTGGTPASITQPFAATLSTAGNSGGTTATLKPLTVYAVNLYLKVSSVPAAGVLAVELTDGSNTIVADAAGNNNAGTVTLSGTTTSFVAHSFFFRTPAVIPATGFRLRLRLSTDIDSGKTLYLGHLAVHPADLLYAGGPYVGLFSGNPNFILGDYITLTVSNAHDSAWQFLADRLFNMRSLGLQLPSSGSPTILDSLIA